MKVLVLNGGSSSFKCWFCDLGEDSLPEEAPKPLWEAKVDWGRDSRAQIRIRSNAGTRETSIPVASATEMLPPVLESLWNGATKVIEAPGDIDVIGHRIVHGGKAYRETTTLTPELRAAIARQAEFAPAHNRFELEAIEVVDHLLGNRAQQIAVFDTGFHATLAPPAYVYPGPCQWLDLGIRRYGFHGISHQYAARRAAQILGARQDSLRLIICHLGNGCSLAGVCDGKSVDTSMGFTPLDGLMMGTRSGSLDPGILIFLLRHCGYAADQLEKILNQESGLKGISGLSGDMREIVAAMAEGNPRAKLAFDIYAHRLCREVGAMLAVLGGMDALVFTGGVGENCAPLRELVCRRFEFLGLRIDANRNAKSPMDEDIAEPDSRSRVLVIRAEEDWEIARECWRLYLHPNN